MFSTHINLSPNNDAAFRRVKQVVLEGDANEVFVKGLEELNPTPAQLFQLLEINLLSDSALPKKKELMQVIGERAASAGENIIVSFGEGDAAMELIRAYEDANKTTTFCQEELAQILENTRGKNGLSADDLNSYQFAKLQDKLRFILRIKRLPVEDRDGYSDPAPSEVERTREEFLAGEGLFYPSRDRAFADILQLSSGP